jgi:hypothetical protein
MLHADRILVYSSTKENGKDTLIYVSKLVNSSTGVRANSEAFTLPSTLITPPASDGKTTMWTIRSISLDDRYMIVAKLESSSYQPLYLVNISDTATAPSQPEYIALPGVISEEDTATSYATFSQDPSQPHLLYLITDAYSDFASVLAYDIQSKSIAHITTPEPDLHAIRPIPWDAGSLHVSEEHVMFKANIDGWDELFVHPLKGKYKGQVIQIKFDQEVVKFSYLPNTRNGKPWQLVMSLASSRRAPSLFCLDLEPTLDNLKTEEGNALVHASLKAYEQAQAFLPAYRTLPAQLIKYTSFDGLEIPVMYYHPADRQQAVPLIIYMHGGPASQSTPLPAPYDTLVLSFPFGATCC